MAVYLVIAAAADYLPTYNLLYKLDAHYSQQCF